MMGDLQGDRRTALLRYGLLRCALLVQASLMVVGCGETPDAPDGARLDGAVRAADGGMDGGAGLDADIDGSADAGGAECAITFPAADAGSPSDAGSGEPPDGATDAGGIDPDPDGLIAEWTLDGTWSDSRGGHDATPFRAGGFSPANHVRGGANQAYGPTSALDDNGATVPGLTTLAEARGVTIEGWLWLPGNSTGGVLFGFGDGAYDRPSMVVRAAWGYIQLTLGRLTERRVAWLPRLGDRCWHHVAVVLPADFRSGGALRAYVDGAPAMLWADTSATSAVDPDVRDVVFRGEPFRLGTFSMSQAGAMRIDEVRLWERALSDAEVRLAATAAGPGSSCSATTMDWEPGPRCEFDGRERTVRMETLVRVLDDETVVLVSDPSAWIRERLEEHCGAYLRVMEENLASLPEWWPVIQYRLALRDVLIRYRPQIMESLSRPDHFLAAACEIPARPVERVALWPESIGEAEVPRSGTSGDSIRLDVADVAYFSYLRLPFRLRSGERYAVADSWGNRADFLFDERETLSWAIKVNQVGYLADAPHKYAYLGAWLAHAGPMDLSRFVGAPFEVVREEDGALAFVGSIALRMDDPSFLTGESVHEMDFSELRTPGRYHVRIPGVGRSWSFVIGQDALGEAHYVHARGLYHQRCGTEISAAHTPWARGDAHQTFRGGFPPDTTDYADHSADGWGFRDAAGAHVPVQPFEAVSLTATTEPLVGVFGGWHDAADYDRRPMHFEIVRDLATAYLLFPRNFSDGQLDIPESGNGIPDILDQARWGIDVWARAQEASGAVGTWIEADSHPREMDPGADTQPYYLSLATRNSSLHYARHAALIGRALATAGRSVEAAPYLRSAEAAYAFGVDPAVRVSTSFMRGGSPVEWIEPAIPDPSRRVQALIQIWLATGERRYRDELSTPEMEAAFDLEVRHLHWRTSAFDLVDVAIGGADFPAGWQASARAAIVSRANDLGAWQATHAYRRPWYDIDHGYFSLMGWGNNGLVRLIPMVAAWRLTGDETYRDWALLGVDWAHGANAQGRVNTTGLGHHNVATLLHLPSWADDIAEPVPGLTIYGGGVGIPWQVRTQVFGLFFDSRSAPPFEGSAISLMPPPWDDRAWTTDEMGDLLYGVIPRWRRLAIFEAGLPPVMEFTVHESIGPAAAVVGCLMGEGWTPPAGLRERVPRTEAALRASLLVQP